MARHHVVRAHGVGVGERAADQGVTLYSVIMLSTDFRLDSSSEIQKYADTIYVGAKRPCAAFI